MFQSKFKAQLDQSPLNDTGFRSANLIGPMAKVYLSFSESKAGNCENRRNFVYKVFGTCDFGNFFEVVFRTFSQNSRIIFCQRPASPYGQ